MMEGSTKIVKSCANVRPSETVVIVTEKDRLDIAELIARAADERGAQTSILIVNPTRKDCEELPEPVAAAMKSADVIFGVTEYSLTHTKARRNASKAGARFLSMPAFTRDMLVTGGIEVDFQERKHVVERISSLLSNARKARITTVKGTDISMSIGRKAVATYIAHEPGSFAAPPNIEVATAPIEGTARGMIVVDGSITVPDIGLLTEPVKLTVQKGLVTEINGNRDARKFEAKMKSFADPTVYNIAELGIGLNPAAKITGNLLEDEGALRTIHIGLGNNISFGGRVNATTHVDTVVINPTIQLDERIIMKHGDILVMRKKEKRHHMQAQGDIATIHRRGDRSMKYNFGAPSHPRMCRP
jgi:2,5-dihydroxypyridine 5,6-dioxygenase